MNLFGNKKNSGNDGTQEKSTAVKAEATNTEKLDVKILGSGCKKCNELEENTKKALQQLGIDAVIDHVTDFTVIASYGVMTTPALVVNGKVVSYGKVLKTNEAVEILKKLDLQK